MPLSSQKGFGSLALTLGITVVLFVFVLIFGIWAFAGLLDYKDNFDAKLAQQVAVAKQAEDKAKDAEFAETSKSPLKTYRGPSAYGSVTAKYPRTWSGYVVDTRNSSPFVDGYFYPGVVPDIQQQSSAFALRIQVVGTSYSEQLNSLSGFVKQGATKVSPFSAPKVSNIVGARIEGKLTNGKNGTMVMIPLRNMTLKIWTEAPQFQKDFTKYILPNFTFAP